MDPEALSRKQAGDQFAANWVSNKTAAVVTIPVVVHVLYNQSVENVSNAQIQSQIDVLNEDFRKMNADTVGISHAFYSFISDTEIEFCLATNDPAGNQTTGVTRTQTDSTSFAGVDNEKFSSSGGKDGWDPTKYLNIWVCNLGQTGTLGYATIPSDLSSFPSYDGVVIDYRAFGRTGTAGTGGFDVNGDGRTGTHEVGHWLNLEHIWGDAQCGDDLVGDTPEHEFENYGCPTFPYNADNSCTNGTGSGGEMYMNYMDYTDDTCMNMFTAGQKARMNAALNGDRSAILTSNGCAPSVGIDDMIRDLQFDLFPNPSSGNFKLEFFNSPAAEIELTIQSSLGETIYSRSENTSTELKLDLSSSPNGIYFVTVKTNDIRITKKAVLHR